LRHLLLDCPGQSVEHHSRQINVMTGVVDVDAHNPAYGIVIDDNTGGEFLTVDARLITEGDRERVGVSEVLEFLDAISASSIGLFMFSRP